MVQRQLVIAKCGGFGEIPRVGMKKTPYFVAFSCFLGDVRAFGEYR